MRIACCLALAVAALAAAPASADAQVVIAFLPAETDEGLLERMADADLAVAVVSPTAGGTAATQTYLDMSQGTRVSSRVYEEELPSLRLRQDGRIEGWDGVVRRANDAPGDVIPGLLGEQLRRTAYAGIAGLSHDEAAVAADRSGRVDTVSLGPRAGFGARLADLVPRHDLVVARLPTGTGLGPLETLPPNADVIVVRAPSRARLALLPAGATIGDGLLTSRTTRRDGMVAVTDFAPTVLRRLGLEIPDEMQGRPITATGASWEDAQSLADRLANIKGRRSFALLVAFGAWLALTGALAVAGRARLGLRLGLLGAMWLPGLALLTGALDPPRAAEAAILAVGSLVLAAATDRLIGWPRAPALPAAAVLTAHAVDLVAGSPLIVRSLAGPNPGFGARFFGIGNELEAILTATLLIGVGALLAGRRDRNVPLAFGIACAIAAVFVGAGRLGADVGGVITLAAGAAAAVLASLPGGITWRAVAVAIAAPAIALGCLAAIDIATGGDSHFTRSVLGADSAGELVEVAERRFDIAWNALKKDTTPISVAVFAAVLVWGVVRRSDVLAPLEGDRAFAAGMWGVLSATVVGALANDSAPTIFLVGAAALVLAAGYLAGKPPGVVLT